MTDTAPIRRRLRPTRHDARAFAEFWYYFSENRGAVIGFWFFMFLVVLAIFAPWIAPHAPDGKYRDAARCCRHSGRRAAIPAICSAPMRSAATCSPG